MTPRSVRARIKREYMTSILVGGVERHPQIQILKFSASTVLPTHGDEIHIKPFRYIEEKLRKQQNDVDLNWCFNGKKSPTVDASTLHANAISATNSKPSLACFEIRNKSNWRYLCIRYRDVSRLPTVSLLSEVLSTC